MLIMAPRSLYKFLDEFNDVMEFLEVFIQRLNFVLGTFWRLLSSQEHFWLPVSRNKLPGKHQLHHQQLPIALHFTKIIL